MHFIVKFIVPIYNPRLGALFPNNNKVPLTHIKTTQQKVGKKVASRSISMMAMSDQYYILFIECTGRWEQKNE